MISPIPSLLLRAVLFALTLTVASVHAQTDSDDSSLSIYQDSEQYSYHGCYNETTNVEGSGGSRALPNGITEVREDEMTVPICLDICGKGDEEYHYAGLQWARECWCSHSLAGIAEKLDDEECDLACEGDDSMACGGNLKLSVYKLSESGAIGRIHPSLLLSACGAALGIFLLL